MYIVKNLTEEREAPVVNMDWVKLFEPRVENQIHYRLYMPKLSVPSPLVLYLHGGGEAGEDNLKPLTTNLGAAQIAELYPDVGVMVPQTPSEPWKKHTIDQERFADGKMSGWTPEYLQKIFVIIHKMIAEGSIDASRVYVTGAARGGGGVLLAMSRERFLFAAGLAVCPRMTPDTYESLCSLTQEKIMLVLPYADINLYRNQYAVEGMWKLAKKGNRNAELLFYSREELEANGIGAKSDLTLEQKLVENHKIWNLAYQNVDGVLDWLLKQKRED